MHPGYGRLVELAERELSLVRAGHLVELPPLWDERRDVVAELPAIPPAQALEALEYAAEMQGRTTALLEERLELTGAELRRLVRGRAVMHSYAPTTPPAKLVDRAG